MGSILDEIKEYDNKDTWFSRHPVITSFIFVLALIAVFYFSLNGWKMIPLGVK